MAHWRNYLSEERKKKEEQEAHEYALADFKALRKTQKENEEKAEKQKQKENEEKAEKEKEKEKQKENTLARVLAIRGRIDEGLGVKRLRPTSEEKADEGHEVKRLKQTSEEKVYLSDSMG